MKCRRVGDADVVKASAVVDRGRLCMHIAGKDHVSGRVVGTSHKRDRARASHSARREGILNASTTCAVVIEVKVRISNCGHGNDDQHRCAPTDATR